MTRELIKYKTIIVAIALLQLCFLCHGQTETALDSTLFSSPVDSLILQTTDLNTQRKALTDSTKATSITPEEPIKGTTAIENKSARKQKKEATTDSLHVKSKPYESMPDSIYDKLYGVAPDYLSGDSLKEFKRHQRALRRFYLKENFLPDPNKSLWYSLTFPGLGQIYNRKYWKLPIVYGCFVGVTYAIVWTSNQYSDYMRGYKEACDVDPNTNYHLQLLPTGYPANQAEQYMLTQLNSFRRYRDLCIVAGVAVFALSVIDAYVDAQLANFDVSPDLSMKIRPKFDTVYNTGKTAVGCQIQFNF